MIDKKKLPTDLELAKDRAKWELNKYHNKDIFVTLPDGGVYVNSEIDPIQEHAVRNKLRIVVVKKSGKIIEVEENKEEIKIDPPLAVKNKNKK